MCRQRELMESFFYFPNPTYPTTEDACARVTRTYDTNSRTGERIRSLKASFRRYETLECANRQVLRAHEVVSLERRVGLTPKLCHEREHEIRVQPAICFASSHVARGNGLSAQIPWCGPRH